MTVDTEVAIISAIVNSVLATLTGAYVLLTYALLKQAKNTAANSDALFRSQMLILTMPHLELRVRKSEGGGMTMTLTNWGQSPALDIDMWFLGTYDEEEIKALRPLCDPFYIKEWTPDSNGYYYIFERAMHPGVPGGHRLTESLYLPVTGYVDCFFQFRTYTGQNLWMYVSLYDHARSGPSTYTISSSKPSAPIPIERLVFEEKEGCFRSVGLDASLRDEQFVRDYVVGFERSVPWVPKDGNDPTIEDRGRLTKVS